MILNNDSTIWLTLCNYNLFLYDCRLKNVGLLPLGLWSQQSVVSVTMFLHMEAEANRGFRQS